MNTEVLYVRVNRDLREWLDDINYETGQPIAYIVSEALAFARDRKSFRIANWESKTLKKVLAAEAKRAKKRAK